MVESRPRVVIVGGGIGGLFAANALIAHGLSVSVYEQAPALGEIGAGVFLTPNSVRHLQRLGLEPAVEKWGARVGPHSRYFRHDGAPIAPVQVTDSSGWNATFGMRRADMDRGDRRSVVAEVAGVRADPRAPFLHGRLQSEPLQMAHAVRRQEYAGSDLAEGGRLFIDRHRKAMRDQRICGEQAA